MFHWIDVNRETAAWTALFLGLGGVLIASIWDAKCKWRAGAKVVITLIVLAVTAAVCGLWLHAHGVDLLGPVQHQPQITQHQPQTPAATLSATKDSTAADEQADQPSANRHLLAKFTIALAWLTLFAWLTRINWRPKKWTAVKNEAGATVEEPKRRIVSVIASVIMGVCPLIMFFWHATGYLVGLIIVALLLDAIYVVPYLHVYAVFVLQKPVWFLPAGFHIRLPAFLPASILEIQNLMRERIEATEDTQQLPTADTPVKLVSGEESETFSATVSLKNWVVIRTNQVPDIFIRYSTTDRTELKDMMFNAVQAYEAELLLGMTFSEARLKPIYYITNVEMQQLVEMGSSDELKARFKELLQREHSREYVTADDNDWLDLAKKVFTNEVSRKIRQPVNGLTMDQTIEKAVDEKMELYENFIKLRRRLLILFGCLPVDIRVVDRNAEPKIEEALNAATLARLALQTALINVDIAAAEGDANSRREANSLKGVLELIKQGDNAAALAAWTDYRRATENKNIYVGGGLDVGTILANLAKKTMP